VAIRSSFIEFPNFCELKTPKTSPHHLLVFI